MNKLGFYIENSTVAQLRDALRRVKPPTILFHAGDRGLLREIRNGLSPDSFIVGRLFVTTAQQTEWLDSGNPEAAGRAYADQILNYDFGYATERANGRLLVDAWMALNEALPGPASFKNYRLGTPLAQYPEYAEFYQRRAEALDRFQVAMRERLQTQALDAVAFNFGAGNYPAAAHYLDSFPRTLAAYTYLGFHEYGWPTLMPRDGTASAALLYRDVMAGICQRHGNRFKAIITEAGLARMYKIAEGGDVGWLYPPDPLPEALYWDSLNWYNDQLCRDEFVLGACLFQVGHAGRWETFRHLGQDNQLRPLSLINSLATLAALPAPPLNDTCRGAGSPPDPGTAQETYPPDAWRSVADGPARPAWQDDHATLARSTTANYAVRPWNAVKRIVVHHTVTGGDVTPERVAEAQVAQGKPGITYHFLVQADGSVFETNTLRTLTTHTGVDAVNADSIGVALAGNFTTGVPPDAQLTVVTGLLAYLLSQFGLPSSAIIGRSEVEAVSSPGATWLQGPVWKNTLLGRLQARPGRPPDGGATGDIAALRAEIERLKNELTQAQSTIAQLRSQLGGLTQLQADNERLRKQLVDADVTAMSLQAQILDLQTQIGQQQTTIAAQVAQIADLQHQIDELRGGDGGGPPDATPALPPPKLTDVSTSLPTHPTRHYESRPLTAIRRIVIHHTVTRDNIMPQRIAQVQVALGRPGITYHFLIHGDGEIFQTSALTNVVEQTVTPAVNADAIAVAFAGNFSNVAPTAAQIDAGAALIAWLLQEFHVPLEAVVGRLELENVASPGNQWQQGVAWKGLLLQGIRHLA